MHRLTRHQYMILLLAASVWSCIDDGIEDPPVRPDGDVVSPGLHVAHKVVVSHNVVVSISEQAARAALSTASGRLTDRRDAADTRCCVEFQLATLRTDRRGDLPVAIRNANDLQQVRDASPANRGAFLVVDGLAFCNGPVFGDGRLEGCTRQGQLPAIVSDTTGGAVWAHEFGHAQGLAHLACSVDDGAARIMHSGCASEELLQRVTPEECAAFRRLRPQAEGEAVASGNGLPCRQQD